MGEITPDADGVKLRTYYRPCKLYRIFDAAGVLLYVGVTVYPHDRIVTHRREQSWGAEIARVDYETWPSEYVARLAEHIAIHDESPLHNRDRATARHVADCRNYLRREMAEQ